MALDEGILLDRDQPALSADALRHITNHVFLPPKLPQQDDSAPEHDDALEKLVLEALIGFEASRGCSQSCSGAIIKMLQNIISSRSPQGDLLQNIIEDQIGSMDDKGKTHFETSLEVSNLESQTCSLSTSKLRTPPSLCAGKEMNTSSRRLKFPVPTPQLWECKADCNDYYQVRQ
jgi:hypothetical protein